jgi:hypothetical protein
MKKTYIIGILACLLFPFISMQAQTAKSEYPFDTDFYSKATLESYMEDAPFKNGIQYKIVKNVVYDTLTVNRYFSFNTFSRVSKISSTKLPYNMPLYCIEWSVNRDKIYKEQFTHGASFAIMGNVTLDEIYVEDAYIPEKKIHLKYCKINCLKVKTYIGWIQAEDMYLKTVLTTDKFKRNQTEMCTQGSRMFRAYQDLFTKDAAFRSKTIESLE